MANIISWLDDYLIGIDEVDKQHKYLFDLVNEMIQCEQKDKLQLLLIKLYKCTREHFNSEEVIMKKIGYPKYEEHKELHNQLIGMLNEKAKIAIFDPLKRDELNDILRSWIVTHILQDDLDIANFMIKKTT